MVYAKRPLSDEGANEASTAVDFGHDTNQKEVDQSRIYRRFEHDDRQDQRRDYAKKIDIPVAAWQAPFSRKRLRD